jgi:hypothetical protein
MAPHSLADIASSKWNRPYARELGAFPAVSVEPHLLKLSDKFARSLRSQCIESFLLTAAIAIFCTNHRQDIGLSVSLEPFT